MYFSNDIHVGDLITIVPSWLNPNKEENPDTNPAAKRTVPVVYIHPQKRYFSVEYTYTWKEPYGIWRTEKFRESFPMVDPDRLCSHCDKWKTPWFGKEYRNVFK